MTAGVAGRDSPNNGRGVARKPRPPQRIILTKVSRGNAAT